MFKTTITQEMLLRWPGLGWAKTMTHDHDGCRWRLEFATQPRPLTIIMDDRADAVDGGLSCYIPGAFEPFYDNRLFATAQKVLPKPGAYCAEMVLPGQKKAPEWPFMLQMKMATGNFQPGVIENPTFTLDKPSKAKAALLLLIAQGEAAPQALETLSVKVKTLIRAPMYVNLRAPAEEPSGWSAMLLVMPLTKTTRWLSAMMLRRQKLAESLYEARSEKELALIALWRDQVEQNLQEVEKMLPMAWRVHQTRQGVALMVADKVKQFCYDETGVKDATRLCVAVREMMRALDVELLD